MLRRDFGKAAFGAIASTALRSSATAAEAPRSEFPKTSGLTDYVGSFVATTKYEDIPQDVIALGKKSILDGLGLALAGATAQTRTICRQYVEQLGICHGKAIIIGSSRRTSPRLHGFMTVVSNNRDKFDGP